jgi:hypothetical protein
MSADHPKGAHGWDVSSRCRAAGGCFGVQVQGGIAERRARRCGAILL